jgi:hypothetical protein
MARGPEGDLPEGTACAGLSADEQAFLTGFEGVLDRALVRLRPGERFVFGVHQELPAAVAECLVQRYRAAGWTGVELIPGETGGCTLLLEP